MRAYTQGVTSSNQPRGVESGEEGGLHEGGTQQYIAALRAVL